MVDVTLRGDVAIFEPRGWSKLWTLEARLTVPLSAVRAVRRAPPGVGRGWWKGWRLPGTHLPGVIVAGSYYGDGAWTFWDVRGAGDRAIEVELEGTRYRRLVVDVSDPEAEVERLGAAIGRGIA
jgi:hypothetical protein